jgi:hypothetical protein
VKILHPKLKDFWDTGEVNYGSETYLIIRFAGEGVIFNLA